MVPLNYSQLESSQAETPKDILFLDPGHHMANLHTTWRGFKVTAWIQFGHPAFSISEVVKTIAKIHQRLDTLSTLPNFSTYVLPQNVTVTLTIKEEDSSTEEASNSDQGLVSAISKTQRRLSSSYKRTPKRVKFSHEEEIKLTYQALDIFTGRVNKRVHISQEVGPDKIPRTGKRLSERLRPYHEKASLERLRCEAIEDFKNSGVEYPESDAILAKMKKFNKRRVEFTRGELLDLLRDVQMVDCNLNNYDNLIMASYMLQGLFQMPVEINKHRKDSRGMEFTVSYLLVNDSAFKINFEGIKTKRQKTEVT